MRFARWTRWAALFFLPITSLARQDAPPTSESPLAAVQASAFEIVLDPSVSPASYSGRVYIVFSTKQIAEPKRRMGDWFARTQVVAWEVRDAKPGTALALTDAAMGWPETPSTMPAGEYTVQAVARVNPDSPKPGQGAGDLYSKPLLVKFDRSVPTFAPTRVVLDQVVKPREFRETERLKLVEIRSERLSAFLGRDRLIRAGVALPKEWTDDPVKRYPTLVWVPGFGGDHHSVMMISRLLGDECLVIVPDPSCFRGHSVFADSATNGPWGAALVEELIPAVETKFHGAKSADRRFVSGMSSGGWSSLWLQVAYPDFFGGVWSHCPDPVDFRDFQTINLYAPSMNLFTDESGGKRPVARGEGDNVALFMRDFIAQEEVMGPGGQIHSFEAVFSPRLPDGTPRLIFDRTTGAIDADAAKTWEPYDLRLKLEREWAILEPKLKGKIHVYAGGLDTFYLEGAAKLLQESLKALGSDAVVEIIPDMPHTIHRPGIKTMLEEIKRRTGTP